MDDFTEDLVGHTRWDSLSAVELRVIDLTRDGCSDEEIAESLNLSSRTVEIHLNRILRKIDLTDRTQLASEGGWPTQSVD